MHLKAKLEFIWWVITAVVICGILYPIYVTDLSYPFWYHNILFIIVSITLTRYIFLLKYTWLAQRHKIKLVLLFLSIPSIFYLISTLNFFQTFMDAHGLESLFNNHPLKFINHLTKYIRSEMLFFGTASLISAVIFPFRMLVSIWRNRNRGTV